MSAAAKLKADLILHARLIRTFDARRPLARSLAVADGRIIALGTPRQLAPLRSRRTRIVHAPQAVAVPAFTDCHTHLFNWACQMDLLDLSRTGSPARVLSAIRARAARTAHGHWLFVRGLNLSILADSSASQNPRRILDALTPGRPTIVHSRDGHSAWVNSAGLRAAGITAKTRTPPGGRIPRDHSGRPVGILQEQALALLPSLKDTLTDRQIMAGLRRAIRRAHRWGITTVHSIEGRRAFEWFSRLRRAGKLHLRICWAMPANMLDAAIETGLHSGFGDELLWIGGVKIFADGSLGSQTAYMYHAYPHRRGYRGQATCVGHQLRKLAEQAARANLAVWIHAIGDRANHEALAAIAAARRVEPARLAHRIEHAQCVRPADVRRFGQLGIIASMQPCHIPGDIALATRYWPRASRWAYPCRSLAKAGATLAFGSDVPVETLDPIAGLRAAVNRQDHAGQPPDGWYPTERLTVRQALLAYTLGAAAAGGRPGKMGRLSEGIPADIALLSNDPLQSPRTQLTDLHVIGTIFNGRVVYEA